MEQKKCIVLDLDNTLWGGVVGEDGIDGIALSLEAPGNSFMAFQQALLDLAGRGVILAINSRNNPEDALAVIRTHPNMVLKENHFAASRINWEDKATNIRALAEELNIGLDSMVFLDDDPTNRAMVRSLVPEVEVPELPADPSEYTRFLSSLPYFPDDAATDEDAMRGNFYVTERIRRHEESAASSKEEFLASLGLELDVYEDDSSALTRLSQMTGKTNQFNIDKKEYDEDSIRMFIEQPTHAVFHARLRDRFGDYGVIALAIVEIEGETARFDSLLMSCRVFGRGVEDAFVATIMHTLAGRGVQTISVATRETEKNQPARDFATRVFPEGTRDTSSFAVPSWIEARYHKAS